MDGWGRVELKQEKEGERGEQMGWGRKGGMQFGEGEEEEVGRLFSLF